MSRSNLNLKKENNKVMSKPIFTLGLPNLIEEEQFNTIKLDLETRLIDYHVLLYMHSGEDLIFQCFNNENYTEINHEELKELILNHITKKRK